MKMGLEDATAFKVGLDNIVKIMHGTARVWPNGGGIDDFNASDSSYTAVTCTWSAWDVEPAPQYDLYENGLMVAQLVTSPHIREVSSGTRDYYVVGFNTNETYESNHDNGSVQEYIPPPEGYPPGYINDFTASDDQQEQITFTWSDAGGNPPAQYRIYDGDDSLIASGARNGHVESYPGGTSQWFYIEAYNNEGTTQGNGNNGTALYEAPPPICTPGSEEWVIPGLYEWVVPEGVTEVTLCMAGAGGQGGANATDGATGGHAGTLVESAIASVSPGQYITIMVGDHHENPSGGHGYAGDQSTFGGWVAEGGAGGKSNTAVEGGYWGEGASRDTCYGTQTDGERVGNLYGGQAGFGGGGWADGGHSYAGGGGGGGSAAGGEGGAGLVKITWNCN